MQVNWLSGKKKKKKQEGGKKLYFVSCAHFHGVNTSTRADFKLPNLTSLELGRDGRDWPPWPGQGSPAQGTVPHSQIPGGTSMCASVL